MSERKEFVEEEGDGLSVFGTDHSASLGRWAPVDEEALWPAGAAISRPPDTWCASGAGPGPGCVSLSDFENRTREAVAQHLSSVGRFGCSSCARLETPTGL